MVTAREFVPDLRSLAEVAAVCVLRGLSAERLASDPILISPLLENFVAMELRKQASWSRTQPHLFHFRTQSGQEVDDVLEDPAGRIVGVEVKAAATVGARDFRGLRALAEATGDRSRRGIVLYTARTAVPFGKNLYALPVSALWNHST